MKPTYKNELIREQSSIKSVVLQENKKTVYLVDDDQDDRQFGCNALAKIDSVQEVIPTKNADDLFDCLKKFGLYQDTLKTDKDTPIILLDIHMPGADGIEVLQKIRNHPITSEFYVIILTTDNSCEQAQYYMTTVVSASERMQMLIKDLLEYSQVQKGDLKIEQTDLNKVYNDVIENLSSVIKDSKASVTTTPLPTVITAPSYVTRTIQNIVGNALKYKHPNRNPKIHVSAQEEDDEWVISITDNGIGMKSEYLDQIFVLFKRLHNNDEYQGTGIGLSICEKMINRLGGKLWVTSTENEGSEFYFTIPKTEEGL